jgi:hypothetical protein
MPKRKKWWGKGQGTVNRGKGEDHLQRGVEVVVTVATSFASDGRRGDREVSRCEDRMECVEGGDGMR